MDIKLGVLLASGALTLAEQEMQMRANSVWPAGLAGLKVRLYYSQQAMLPQFYPTLNHNETQRTQFFLLRD